MAGRRRSRWLDIVNAGDYILGNSRGRVAMDDAVQQALESDRNVDITTTGRKSGQPRRIEIWHHLVDGAVYITGLPGKRSWYANVVANPDITFHLKESVQRDFPARAVAVTDEAARREIFAKMKATEGVWATWTWSAGWRRAR